MSIGFERRCAMVSVRIPTALLLSICNGMGLCLWPSSWRVVASGTLSRVLMKAAPISASMADAIIASIILQMTRMDPLSGGAGEFGSIG